MQGFGRLRYEYSWDNENEQDFNYDVLIKSDLNIAKTVIIAYEWGIFYKVDYSIKTLSNQWIYEKVSLIFFK